MFSDMTNINLKEMIFKQRMSDIENDVVPFGFIDDGSDAISEIENREYNEKNEWGLPVFYEHDNYKF
jgi:hypothetical protein